MDDIQDMIFEAARPQQVTIERSTRTGITSLDIALGGSLPVGAVEIFGEDSVGKTSLIYQILAHAQRCHYQAGLCASEYLDIPMMRHLGVVLEDLVLFRGSGVEVLDAMMEFQYQASYRRQPIVLAIDSMTALRPEGEERGDWPVMVDRYLDRAATGIPPGSVLLVVSQVRARRSRDPRKVFAGGVETSLRGFSGRFAARMQLTREGVEDENYTMVVDVLTNVFRQAFFLTRLPFRKGHGVQISLDLASMADRCGVFQRAGAWLSYGELKWQGIEAAADALDSTPELLGEVQQRVMKAAGY
jgi:hypothetical protein